MSGQLVRKYKELKAYSLTQEKPLTHLAKFLFVKMRCRLNHNKPLVFKWIEGLQYKASKLDAGIFANTYMTLYDVEESVFVTHFLRENDTFLDVGSNVGHFSLLASGITKCQSIAIEPVPSTFKKLRENIHLNGLHQKIEAHNIGVSKTSGKLFFSQDQGTVNQIVSSDYPRAVEVDVKTIDEIVGDRPVPLMKIDIEGHEFFALTGAEKLLSSHHLCAIVIELNGSGDTFGVNDLQTDELLKSYQFFPYYYDPFKKRLSPLGGINKASYNTIYIRNIEFVQKRINEAKKIRVGELSL